MFCSRPVSRVLFGSGFCKRVKNRFPSFIWSCHCWQDHTIYPPATDEQSLMPVYMIFQPMRCTASSVTKGTGELLPRLFTLSPDVSVSDGFFLLHFYTLADIYPLGSMALCVARTFLPRRFVRERWNSLLQCKGSKSSAEWV